MPTHRTNTLFLIIALSILIIADTFFDISWFYYLIVFIIWFVILAMGSGLIGLNYHVKALIKGDSIKKQIAITFDDGPTPFTEKILDLLLTSGTKATFFCIGKQIVKYPEIFKRIVSEGHTIGNHSFTHSTAIGFFPTERITREISQTDTAIYDAVGLRTKFYRPPFGVTNPQIAKALKLTGHFVIGWSIRSLDTKIKSERKILNRITRRLKPGAIILLHDTSDKSVRVLEQLLVLAQKNRLEPVTVDQLLKIPAYEK